MRVTKHLPLTMLSMKTTPLFGFFILTTAIILLGTGCQNHDQHEHATAEALLPPGTKPYPLKVCLVTEEKFDHGKPHSFAHEGQEIKLCCEDCLADFKKDPAKHLSKLTSK